MMTVWTPLPVDHWPEPDRQAWLAALADGGPLDNIGAAANWSAATRLKNGEGYGRWLAFLAAEDPDALAEHPTARVTTERLDTYLASIGHKALYTRFNAVDELWAMLRLFDPKADYTVLRKVWYRLKHRAEQGTSRKNGRIVASTRLLEAGLGHFEAAANRAFPVAAAVQARDGLMVALLALRPLRRRNLADLVLGRSLIRTGDGWRIRYDPHEIKTGRAIELPWPAVLDEALATYLDQYRPVLLKGADNNHLWITQMATPMAPHSISVRVSEVTSRLLGIDVSPHLFRDSLATTMAIEDPDHIRAATVLLGHTTPRTVERHYNQAQSIDAARQYQAALLDRLEADRRR
ncbi:MAG: tyrosine-type recombinase/integrase [Alphaproteobacteria bacterium]